MVRQGLINTLAELYSASPDVDIVRLTTQTLDKLVRKFQTFYSVRMRF